MTASALTGLDDVGIWRPKSGEIAQEPGRCQGHELSHLISAGQTAAGTWQC